MYWIYWIIILGIGLFLLNKSYKNKIKRRNTGNPKCEVCGSPMELQTKLGDNEIWECPKCAVQKTDSKNF